MEMFWLLGLMIFGFVMVIKGADFLVEGAVALSRRYHVSEMVIALTVIAFGTSMPELTINLIASSTGQSDIVFGNIIGSNIVNILLILGIAGLINPIVMRKNTVWKEIPYSLIAVAVLFFLTRDGILSRDDAAVFLCFFIGFLVYIYFIAQKGELETEPVEQVSKLKMFSLLVFGLIGLIWGGKLVVDSAVDIARAFKVSEKFISLLIIGAGTSFPELMTSIVAARKGNSDIVIGNIVGTNIFNIFLIIGAGGLVKPIFYDKKFDFDIGVLTYATLILIASAFMFKKHVIQRRSAFIMLISYLVYVGYTMYIYIYKV